MGDASPTTDLPPPPDAFAAAEARIGLALNAKWTLERLLGVGGMGSVFAAKHRNGSRAAVKLLHSELTNDPQIRDRFLREGRIANCVEHPARVAVIDDDVSDSGEPFLVMELLEGETLGQLRQRSGGRVPLEETLRVFDTVLDLLAECHSAGIVHRDIKPANIFITGRGSVKVLDFGVARMREPSSKRVATRAGTALGTPSFMAPEQALGLASQVDGRSDIWSVGACIYASLTGTRLNNAPNEAEAFVMAATQVAPSIALIAPELPAEVISFVDKALAFERAKRFQDAASMRAELTKLLAALREGRLLETAGATEQGDAGIGEEQQRELQEMLSAIWKQIGVCFEHVRQHGWKHAVSKRELTRAHEQIVDALAAHPEDVLWDVGPAAFLSGGVPVWVPERAPFDCIPRQLFADGVRRVQLQQGLTEGELRDLIGILLCDVSGGRSAEEDAVTALWDCGFEHVAYVAIDPFEEGEKNGQLLAQRTAVLAAHLTSQEGGAAVEPALDALTRATLGTQLKMGDEQWRERFVDAFADGYLDARSRGTLGLLDRPLREWTSARVAAKEHADAFAFFLAVTAALAAERPEHADILERNVGAVMLPGETVAAILQDLMRESRDATSEASNKEAPDTATMANGISRALALIDDDSMLELACECYDSFRSETLRGVMLAYLWRWAKGNETKLATVLETTGMTMGMALVKLLGELDTPEARLALEHAFASPHLALRIEAMRSVPADREERVRAEVQKLLGDPTYSARHEALRLIAARGLVAAEPAMVQHIQSPGFHATDRDERRAWLTALAELNSGRAEAVCIELLTNHKLIPSEALEATRALAADTLGGMSSDAALEAARKATKKHWWNTATVREAAERAVVSIEARRATGAQT